MSICLLQAALRTYHEDDAHELTKFLSDDTQHRLEQIEVSAAPLEVLASIEALPSNVHYSWLAEFLKGEERAMQSLYLGSLSQPLAEMLSGLLEAPIAKLAPPLKTFFLAGLIGQLKPEWVLPACCLPGSPLNELLHMRKRHLVRLIGFLGLRDLATALKKVIDQEMIQHTRNLLTKAQNDYLDRCMRESDPLVQELNIEKGDQAALTRSLQMQGLRRLGKGFAHENRSLQWHLAHHLDKGRGEFLLVHTREGIDHNLSAKLKEQIVDLMDVLS